MKIVKLSVSNLKRVQAAEITPDGNIVEIRGRNGQGKSSIIDSIAYALGGKDLCPVKPIRDGADFAEVFVDIGDYRVTRRFTAKGSYLKVQRADGTAEDSPQSILDKLIGALSFDPFEFQRKKPLDQRRSSCRMVAVQCEGCLSESVETWLPCPRLRAVHGVREDVFEIAGWLRQETRDCETETDMG